MTYITHPGQAPKQHLDETRNAFDGIKLPFNQIIKSGSVIVNIEVSLIGEAISSEKKAIPLSSQYQNRYRNPVGKKHSNAGVDSWRLRDEKAFLAATG